MQNFINKFKYFILGGLVVMGSFVIAAGTPISIPSAPGSGYFWVSTTTGAAISTSTTNMFIGSLYASSTTASNYIFGVLLLPSLSQGVSYIGSSGKLNTVSSSTPTVTAPITYSGTLGSFLGGIAGTFDCTTANASTKGCISGADFSKFNSATTTFSTGLTYTGGTNAVTVNTSQNISTLSNLTANGIVYTAGGTGALNTVATSTLTGTGLISVTAGAYVPGATPIIVSCATCGTGTVTGVTGTYPIISSGGNTPAISIAFGTTTSNTWGGTQSFTNTANFNTWTNNGSATTTNLAITSLTGVLVGNGSTKPISIAISGTDFKTINGSSILGSGNLSVTGGSGLSSSTPWTLGSLVVANDNGSVTTIATSTIKTSELTNDAGFLNAVTPGGLDTELQMNNAGTLSGTSGLTWTGGNNLNITGGLSMNGGNVIIDASGNITTTAQMQSGTILNSGFAVDVNGGVTITAPGSLKLSGITSSLLKTDGTDIVGAATNGTDYTLITDTTCSGTDKVSAISASGSVTCSTDSTGGSPAFTPTAYGASTSTTLGLLGGFFSTASSTISSTFRLPALSNGGLAVFNGTVGSYATSTLATITGTLTVAKGGTNATSFPLNSILTSGSAGTTVTATGTQLTVGNLLATTTATSTFLGPITVGSRTPLAMANALFSITGNQNSYIQNHIQNTNTGNNASAVFVAGSEKATDASYFTEFGINNSTYAQATFSAQNGGDGFVNSSDGGLVFITASSTNPFADMRFGTGGTASSSLRMNIDYRGYISMGTTTTTKVGTLTIASSTAPQLLLGDIIGTNAQWALRVAGGNLYFATTTAAGTATSSASSALSINSQGSVTIPSLGTGLTLSTGGVLSPYTGTTCTNQFMRSLSASGVGTCATVGSADVSLANLSATDSTLSFSGTYNGSTARTIGINLANANTWTVNQTFNYSSSTVYSSFVTASSTTSLIGTLTGAIISATTRLVTVISAAFTPATEGEIGIDTTSNQFKYFSGGAVRVVSPTLYPAFTYATSTAYTGTTTIPLGPSFVAETWTGVQCFTDAGTVNVSFYDGTNRMNMFNASTTVGTVTLSSNNSFTAGEKRYVDIGTPASSPTKVSCTVAKTIDAD